MTEANEAVEPQKDEPKPTDQGDGAGNDAPPAEPEPEKTDE